MVAKIRQLEVLARLRAIVDGHTHQARKDGRCSRIGGGLSSNGDRVRWFWGALQGMSAPVLSTTGAPMRCARHFWTP
jgi:hypothetical protein